MADDWRARLAGRIETNRLSMKAVSLAAGLGETFVRDILKRGRTPSAENLAAVEAAIDALTGRVPLEPPARDVRHADTQPPNRATLQKDIPTWGTAAGAAAPGKGAFRLSPDPVDFVYRPAGLITARDVYSLYVEGESMSPMYDPGELIYVNPNRPARPGDVVIIQDPIADGPDYEGYLKILVRRTPEWIVTRQLNPAGEVKFRNTLATRIHRVYTNNELFGV